MVEASVLGISLQEGGNTPVLLIFPHNTRNILSLRIGPLEAFSISAALSETDGTPSDEKEAASPDQAGIETEELFSRPYIHQLLQKSIQRLGGKLLAVEVSRTENKELAATLILRGIGGKERIECRPSDGIALALRFGAKVRISSELAAKAEDIETVMPTLSEDLRTIVAARLLSLRDDKGLAPIRDSLLFSALKKARGSIRKSMVDISRQIIKQGRAAGELAASLAEAGSRLASAVAEKQDEKAAQEPGALPAPRPASLPVPRPQPKNSLPKPIETSGSPDTVEAVVIPGQTIVLPNAQGGGKAPTIRISLVRQPAESEALDEVLFPASGIAREALGGLSLSRDEVKAVGNAPSEEDRLATLLRLLSPETKVPM